jgi:hypothetical protein
MVGYKWVALLWKTVTKSRLKDTQVDIEKKLLRKLLFKWMSLICQENSGCQGGVLRDEGSSLID